MAAKLLHSLTDDNPDLQKQIGCMTGIFQLFDRQHIITGRRISGHSPKRLLSGSSHFDSGIFETESNIMYQRPTAKDKNSNKFVNEKQRVSMESSRASFTSSSRSSSFSSLECNRAAQPEPLSFDRMFFPETPSRDPAMSQSSAAPNFGRQSLDLRDVIKDSMYREARGLSVKTTTKEELVHRVVKNKDSRRPLQLSKSNDGSCSVGINEKQTLPVDLKESLRVVAKLREAPWCYNESLERSRSLCESKDRSVFPAPKDAPRFSYDGRELNLSSYGSREGIKSTPKLKELPRLSLDSREGSMRSLNADSKSNFLSRNSQRDSGNSNDRVMGLQQTSGNQARPPSVVEKLMGLETLPDAALSSDSQPGSIKTSPVENCDPFSRSLKSDELCRPIRISNSLRSSWNEPASPCSKNPNSVMKPISSSRVPIEPAPWKHQEASRGSQKSAFRHLKTPARATDSFPTVYSEIEKRLKDLEFTQSGKDLRALKQILEAMQAKGFLDTRRVEPDSNFATRRDHERRYANLHQNARLLNQQRPLGNHVSNLSNNGANSLKTFDSQIVIMKPAKLVEKSGLPSSSVIPIDRLSGLPKPRGGDFADGRKISFNSQTSKEQVTKTSSRETSRSSTEKKKTNNRTLSSTQTSTRSQLLPKENTTSSLKSSGSISPRLQQKKLELEKRSRPPIPPDSIKSRSQPNKQQPESSSPGGKRRPKSANLQQNDDRSSEISSEMRNLSYHEDDSSMLSDGNSVSDPGMGLEVSSSEHGSLTNGSQSPSMKASKYSVSVLVQKKLAQRLSEDGALAEFTSLAPEHPSPVSVLDDTMYSDDTPSPVKQIPDTLKDDETMNSNDNYTREQWDTKNLKSNGVDSGLKSEINRKKLENIEHLVQKLRRLNSSHDEAHTDYIASLCENTNPDHRYISEILLASGLLLRDLTSSPTTFQLHPSGNPINPELFLVLEQTKSSTRQKAEPSTENVVHWKPEKDKFHRKLIFDVINELLVGKLASVGASLVPWLRPYKVARKSLNAQKLLRELCSEIEQLQAKKPECGLEEEDDSLKRIFWEDVMHRSEDWKDFRCEISGMALDVERSIFKDLVSEIVHGEAACSQTKPGRRCRKLFA
ncbi:protein LONGIFOLIA 1-like [Actinidia eriantha]|uniref:protein LONGIFOLIA 1-like n=1 Tax=Actinidia eriantha TaxID=165200 RepID=UPI002586E432|nr:protein LONGIFOLIA 1-like [Actinidia eriantha]